MAHFSLLLSIIIEWRDYKIVPAFISIHNSFSCLVFNLKCEVIFHQLLWPLMGNTQTHGMVFVFVVYFWKLLIFRHFRIFGALLIFGTLDFWHTFDFWVQFRFLGEF